jgi:hypothetical protein
MIIAVEPARCGQSVRVLKYEGLLMFSMYSKGLLPLFKDPDLNILP